ncbi:MAG: hypothetical protein U0Y82_15575 [Thermoleophilia bacterium]
MVSAGLRSGSDHERGPAMSDVVMVVVSVVLMAVFVGTVLAMGRI